MDNFQNKILIQIYPIDRIVKKKAVNGIVLNITSISAEKGGWIHSIKTIF